MTTIDKKELAKTISFMIAHHDKLIERLQKENNEDITVGAFVNSSELFYNRGMKRGLLNLSEKYKLDLEF